MIYNRYPWAYSNLPNTSVPIAAQTEATYLNYKKQKEFEDVGFFLQYYVVRGGEVTVNIKRTDTIDVSDIVVSLNDDIMERDGTSFKATSNNSTYFLDFDKSGEWWWGNSHPLGIAGTDYLQIAVVTTNSYGVINDIIDMRGHVGGFLLKDEYGLDNYVRKGELELDVKSYGAKGDGITDDTLAIQKAINDSLTKGMVLYFPPGVYLITNSLTISYGTPYIRGAGPGLSSLITTKNIPMIIYDTDSSQFYYSAITDLGFIGDVSGTRNLNSGIEIRGTSAWKNYFNFNTFENLLFLGTFYGIRSTKSSGQLENHLNWNLFTQIKTTNYGLNNVEHAIKFEFGSGTGNVFDACNLVANTSGLEWGGSGDENIGDITISDCQFGGGGSAIKAQKGATAYGSNITITGCQWDAGNQYSLDFLNMNGFTVQGCNWGGATSLKLEGCSDYSIQGARNMESTYGHTKTTPSNSMVDLFQITFNSAYESAYIEIVTFGLLQGVGTRITRSEYLLSFDGNGISVVMVKDDRSGSSGNQIIHMPTENANPFKISAQLQGANSDNTIIYSQLKVIGSKYKAILL